MADAQCTRFQISLMVGEFDLIARYFAPLAGPEGLGLKDDAALLSPPVGKSLVFTTDASVAGVHFLTDEAPGMIARRLLRTNLSDLAAKGAVPLGYLLTLALPSGINEAWISAFAEGLALDQAAYDIALYGGDTVSTSGPVMASITAIGSVDTMIRRDGAHVGDHVYVTGTIGDAGLGLSIAEGALPNLPSPQREFLRERFRLPSPRVAFGVALANAGLATAAADVSDGLIADSGHIAKASEVHITLRLSATPVSEAASAVLTSGEHSMIDLVAFGDDYEIVFVAPPSAQSAITAIAAKIGTKVTLIGDVEAGAPSIDVLDAAGMSIDLPRHGFVHR
jgi:thiamine-monophosphate kinase